MKSAFGIDDGRVDKGFIGTALKTGEEALHGLRSGIGGKAAMGPLTQAAGRGATVGAGVRSGAGKLKPIGMGMVKTPGRTAAVAGAGGIGVGALATKNNNN